MAKANLPLMLSAWWTWLLKNILRIVKCVVELYEEFIAVQLRVGGLWWWTRTLPSY
jgi:hypothetical protein